MGSRLWPRFPPLAGDGKGKTEVPDMELTAGGFRALIDVSVAWSGGKEGAARDVAGERAARKRRKYGRAAVIAGADSVVPFVVEANGAIGEDADRLLNTIAGVAYDYSREATHSFRHRAADVMAIAVQRGHAELVARALSHIGYPEPQR